jgi:flagellar biosynthesis protein FliQ
MATTILCFLFIVFFRAVGSTSLSRLKFRPRLCAVMQFDYAASGYVTKLILKYIGHFSEFIFACRRYFQAGLSCP